MTIGKKFLERVLGEGVVAEAKKPRNLDIDEFDEKLQELGSAAEMYLSAGKKAKLLKMYNSGTDIKAVSISANDPDEWVKKTRAKYEAKGWKFFHYEENGSSHEILFTKSPVNKQLDEAKRDVDGFKDDFDITTLPATSPAISNLPMPMARQVVQLYHLMGVSAETLEMRPKAVKEAAMAVADEMRTNRPLRLAAQRVFAALATAKGFARQEETVTEATASMAPEKDMQLMGNTIVKQIEAVLAALKLPAGILQRAMRRDQQAMMETAEVLRTGVARLRFAMLASELGVDLTAMQQTVKVQEAATMDGPQLGANRAAQAMETLIGALDLQNVFNSREAMAVRRALPEKMAALRNPTAVYTLIDRLVKELANTKR